MKKRNVLAVFALASLLSVAGCGNKRPSESPTAHPSDAGATPSVSDTGKKEAPNDPYSALLSDLDTSKDIFGDERHQNGRTYLGGYTERVKGVMTSFGWISYQTKWGKYGVAVKITYSEAGKVLSLHLGAPEEEIHNFTPSYAAGAGSAAYAKYIAEYEQNLNRTFANKSALSLFKAIKDAKCAPEMEPSEAKPGVFTPSSSDTIVLTGATQTKARTDRALFAGVLAYLLKVSPVTSTLTHVAAQIKEVGTDKAPTIGHIKTSDGSYGYSVYTKYGSQYGAAVKIATYPNKTIRHVYVGTPTFASHNFTPWYALTAPDQFLSFYQSAEDNVNKALVGKVIDEALLEKYSKAVPGLVPADDRFVGTGATQTDSRLASALYAALQGVLSSDPVKDPDEALSAQKALAGLDMAKGTNAFGKDYVTPIAERNGYYLAEQRTAYGWRRYESPWEKGKFYSAATKIVFDENGLVSDTDVGVAKEGDILLTSIYEAAQKDSPLFEENYALYLKQDMKSILLGRSAAEIFRSTLYASVNVSERDSIYQPGDYDFLGAGATQTTARINTALYQAAFAYMYATDPFGSNRIADLAIDGDKLEQNKQVGSGLKAADGTYWGYSLYHVTSWGAWYGAAIGLTISPEGRITKIQTGVPSVTATGRNNKPALVTSLPNFSKNYAYGELGTIGSENYYTYCTSIQSRLEDALIYTYAEGGKTKTADKVVNEALAERFSRAAITIDAKDAEKSIYTPGYRFIGTGATQTDARVGIAVYNALACYLSTKNAA